MKKVLFVVFILFASVSTGFSQYTENDVKAVVDSFFMAMKRSDTAALRATLTAEARLQTVEKVKISTTAAKNEIGTQPIDAFLKVLVGIKPGDADERIDYESIKIEDGLATVWTPYKFFYKGNFSHCGVNAFTLVFLNGLWRIHYIIDTRRSIACPPLASETKSTGKPTPPKIAPKKKPGKPQKG